MKNLFNNYCDFIGVENEGNKRLLIMCIFFISYYTTGWAIETFIQGDAPPQLVNLVACYPLGLPLSIFIIGISIKTYNWVNMDFRVWFGLLF